MQVIFVFSVFGKFFAWELFVVTRDSPYYVFVALCLVVIVVSLIKIAASNENI
jgi:hypothetical protein